MHDANYNGASVLSTVIPGNAVKLLASQIPNFSGSEEDNLEIWLRRVDHAAQVHGVHESVKAIAATSKLMKNAREWFEIDLGAVTTSRVQFREAITRRFRRRSLFGDNMQKVEARKWNYPKKTFQEYAIKKLTFMHPLQLQQKDYVNLIIRGVNNALICGTAAALNIQTVDQPLV